MTSHCLLVAQAVVGLGRSEPPQNDGKCEKLAMYAYDTRFQLLTGRSASAARRIIAAVRTILPVGSILDVGCARGTWLCAWQGAGCSDVLGVDGPYIDRQALEIDPSHFIVADLNERINLGRSFDLVECLEVAEHLSPQRAASLVADLVAHAPAVLFSAATPGQGGENHVNEQLSSFWQTLFARHGYVAIDCLRPMLARWTEIPCWYRYNLILYVRSDALELLPPFVRQFEMSHDQQLPEVSPLHYRLRNIAIRLFPRWVRDRLARWNAFRQI